MARAATIRSAIVAAACLAGLVACGEVDAGTAVAEDFDDYWAARGVDGFEADASGRNTLPFSGELDIRLTAPADVDADGLRDVVDVVCDFEPESGNARVRIDLTVQSLTAPLPCGGSPGFDPDAVLELATTATDLGAADATVSSVGTARMTFRLGDAAVPADADRALQELTTVLPGVVGVFVRDDGSASAEGVPPVVDLTVVGGGRSHRQDVPVG